MFEHGCWEKCHLSGRHQKLVGGLLPLVSEVDPDEDGDEENDGENEILLPSESRMKFGQSGKTLEGSIAPHFFPMYRNLKI